MRLTNKAITEYYNKAIKEYPQLKEVLFSDLKTLIRMKEKYWFNISDAVTYNNVLSVFDDLMVSKKEYDDTNRLNLKEVI